MLLGMLHCSGNEYHEQKYCIENQKDSHHNTPKPGVVVFYQFGFTMVYTTWALISQPQKKTQIQQIYPVPYSQF